MHFSVIMRQKKFSKCFFQFWNNGICSFAEHNYDLCKNWVRLGRHKSVFYPILGWCDRFATPDIPRDKLIINNVGVNRKRFIFWFSAIFQNILKYWDNSKTERVVLKKYAFFKCSNKSDTIEWNVIPCALERNTGS